MAKKNEMVAVNNAAVAIVDNAKKTDKLLNTEQLSTLLIENKLMPRFVCGGYYVGVGIGRTNCFSINTRSKWNEYRIYCNDDTFKAVKGANIAGVKCMSLDNKTDKVRPHTIEVDSTEGLKKVLTVVAKNFKSFCIA